MISLSFLANWNPIWLLIILTILIYGGLKVIKFKGNDFVLALASFLISFMFVSSDKMVGYLSNLVPLVISMVFIIFIAILLVTFSGDNLPELKNGLAIAGLVIGLLVIVLFTFNSFSSVFHLLPATSNSGLSSGLSEFKSYLYSNNIIDSVVFIAAIALCSFFLLKKFD